MEDGVIGDSARRPFLYIKSLYFILQIIGGMLNILKEKSAMSCFYTSLTEKEGIKALGI